MRKYAFNKSKELCTARELFFSLIILFRVAFISHGAGAARRAARASGFAPLFISCDFKNHKSEQQKKNCQNGNRADVFFEEIYYHGITLFHTSLLAANKICNHKKSQRCENRTERAAKRFIRRREKRSYLIYCQGCKISKNRLIAYRK